MASEKQDPELREEISGLACRRAEEMLEEARPAREWLKARRRGEGDPEEWTTHTVKIVGLHARAARLVDEMDRDGFGDVEGRARLAEARDELRKLSDGIARQSNIDEGLVSSS